MAIQATVTVHKIDPQRVEFCYHKLMEMFEAEEFSRPEVMTALAVCLGTQWNGAVMDDALTARFAKDVTDWLAAYFAKGTVQ
jgi:hypothetical protein